MPRNLVEYPRNPYLQHKKKALDPITIHFECRDAKTFQQPICIALPQYVNFTKDYQSCAAEIVERDKWTEEKRSERLPGPIARLLLATCIVKGISARFLWDILTNPTGEYKSEVPLDRPLSSSITTTTHKLVDVVAYVLHNGLDWFTDHPHRTLGYTFDVAEDTKDAVPSRIATVDPAILFDAVRHCSSPGFVHNVLERNRERDFHTRFVIRDLQTKFRVTEVTERDPTDMYFIPPCNRRLYVTKLHGGESWVHWEFCVVKQRAFFGQHPILSNPAFFAVPLNTFICVVDMLHLFSFDWLCQGVTHQGATCFQTVVRPAEPKPVPRVLESGYVVAVDEIETDEEEIRTKEKKKYTKVKQRRVERMQRLRLPLCPQHEKLGLAFVRTLQRCTQLSDDMVGEVMEYLDDSFWTMFQLAPPPEPPVSPKPRVTRSISRKRKRK